MNGIRTTGLPEACAAGAARGSGTIDVLDALVALVAVAGDQLFTSDQPIFERW
jgi:hypothetical protein